MSAAEKKSRKRTGFFSADDFGGCVPASEKIAGCVREGLIQSVSIFGNCEVPEEYLKMLPEGAHVGIHLDLTEGIPVCDTRSIPLLVKNGGRFHDSFFRLMLLSLLRSREIEEQTFRETSAQMERILAALPEDYAIRIDSHRHFHMIPAVFRGLCRALKENERKVSYVRFPAEYLRIYVSTPAVWRYIRPVNLLKVLILKMCGLFDRRIMKEYGMGEPKALFCGVMFSGHMTCSEILPILKKLIRLARRKGKQAEFLFHPGWIGEGEVFPDPDNPFRKVYLSDNRRQEAEALRPLSAHLRSVEKG